MGPCFEMLVRTYFIVSSLEYWGVWNQILQKDSPLLFFFLSLNSLSYLHTSPHRSKDHSFGLGLILYHSIHTNLPIPFIQMVNMPSISKTLCLLLIDPVTTLWNYSADHQQQHMRKLFTILMVCWRSIIAAHIS